MKKYTFVNRTKKEVVLRLAKFGYSCILNTTEMVVSCPKLAESLIKLSDEMGLSYTVTKHATRFSLEDCEVCFDGEDVVFYKTITITEFVDDFYKMDEDEPLKVIISQKRLFDLISLVSAYSPNNELGKSYVGMMIDKMSLPEIVKTHVKRCYKISK